MILWAQGIDIGEGNKEFIRATLGDDFDIAWKMASTLVENHSDLILVPTDVAVEIDEEKVGLTVENLPVPHPIYDIGVETLMQLRPILMQAGCIPMEWTC